MAALDSSTALFDRTNACVRALHQPPASQPADPLDVRSLLNALNHQTLHAHDLMASVPVRDHGRTGSQQQTENLTRWTQSGRDVTGHSDSSGLVMDAVDRERAGEDLKVFKVRGLAVLLCSCVEQHTSRHAPP